MKNPMESFAELWSEARQRGSLTHRNAVCVSTIDTDGYPSSRFVDLKQADERGFVFCTHLASAKAADIARDPRAAITLWWEHVGMQVRIRGVAAPITDGEADLFWSDRSRDAQLVSVTFRQSCPADSAQAIEDEHSRAVLSTPPTELERPADWGGFRLRPDYMEFLEFRDTRLHVRTAYVRDDAGWQVRYLQP